jgi:acyl transferase domain-containing protein/acyl carrier protein
MEPLMQSEPRDLDIAIIGYSGRFPGARNVAEFWQNLCDGVESISFFTDAELSVAGVSQQSIHDPAYIKARGVLGDAACFDASFFGFHPREAEITDPQQRVFLECAYQALGNAGYAPSLYPGTIGVFGGVSENTYRSRMESSGLSQATTPFQIMVGNSKDYLCTRVSYKLNLRGPSLLIQTACSTSLVAVHVACRILLAGECDIALAGAVCIVTPEVSGYFYQPGSISSPDGHCRPFDEEARGTVGGNGVGIVVLKSLQAALEDGDFIHAVIKGTAINNDGAGKVGYTAPSIEGQASVIRQAHLCAEVEPLDVTYVEAHGTGTNLGDPIEMAALTRAFERVPNDHRGNCAIGSVKSNIGHLDTAAGMAGLIKTVLALENKQLPPTLHFREANRKIDFAHSSFFVNDRLRSWETPGKKSRIAGVSSFGIGGTNAHVVLQEAPPQKPSGKSRDWQLLLLSAKDPTVLNQMTVDLAQHLKKNQDENLGDVSYTLALGRDRWRHRKAVLCHNTAEAVTLLSGAGMPKRCLAGTADQPAHSVVFLFPGQGSQYARMGRGLYQNEPVFRRVFNRCARHLLKSLGTDLYSVLYGNSSETTAQDQINETRFTQPALFAVEYALAHVWMEWGLTPQAMLGHSLGEYVAACLAGVFSLEDALELVAIRALLVQDVAPGAMAAVSLSEDETLRSMPPGLSLAAVNGAQQCTVAGPVETVDAWIKSCQARGIACKKIPTSHAFHSSMVESVVERFRGEVERRRKMPPRIPYVSGQTGDWISEEEATSTEYWVRHLREPVRFHAGVKALLVDSPRAFLEVGPGQNLTALARRAGARGEHRQLFVPCLQWSEGQELDLANLLYCAGKLWTEGVEINWHKLYQEEQRRRVPLPSYPFLRQPYWLPGNGAGDIELLDQAATDISNFAWVPVWQRVPPVPRQARVERKLWLIFADEFGLGEGLAQVFARAGSEAVIVEVGNRWEQLAPQRYRLNPEDPDHYPALLAELSHRGQQPIQIAHLWNVTSDEASSPEARSRSFHHLMFLVQALGERWRFNCGIHVIGNGLYSVHGNEALQPWKATVLGICKAVPHEYPEWTCRVIDVARPDSTEPRKKLIDELAAELLAGETAEALVAYRGHQRWVRSFEPYKLEEVTQAQDGLRNEGVYFISGGMGGIGLALAEYLAKTVHARLVLSTRGSFPPRHRWHEWLQAPATHPTRIRIERILRMEALGARVMVAQADVADREQMQNAFDSAVDSFGAIHGVIHAAGVPGKNLLATSTAQVVDSVFYPKVAGTIVLAELAERYNVDFLLLCSSVTALWGGVASSAYAGANSFQDAFSNWYGRNSGYQGRIISVNWGRWHDTGMAAGEKASPAVPTKILKTNPCRTADATGDASPNEIVPAQGQELLKRLVSLARVPQIIISPEGARVRKSDSLVRTTLAKRPNLASPAAQHTRPSLSVSYVAPTDEIQNEIAEIWRQLLGFDRIGIHDNFYELGGDSLLAIQVLARIRESLTVDLPLKEFFREPTVAGVAAAVATESGAGHARTPVIKPLVTAAPLPLSFQEEMYWKLAEIDPKHLSYNLIAGLKLTGDLNVEALQKAFQELIERHDILRTSFSVCDGQPRRIVHPSVPFALATRELEHLPGISRQAEARRLAGEEGNAPFNLSKAPLFRASMFRLAEREHILALAFHHIIADAWSLAVFLDELKRLYGKYAVAAVPALLPLPFRYADYAAWQRDYLAGEKLAGLERYWTKQLDGLVSQMQFRNDPAKRNGSQASPSLEFHLDRRQTEAVRLFSRNEGVTLFSTLLSALVWWIHEQTGCTDMAVGVPVTNRIESGLEQMLGIFVNILVLRTDLSDKPQFQQLVHRVHQAAEQAYVHQEMPFKRLYELVRPERCRHLGRLFQVQFNLIKEPKANLGFEGLLAEDLALADEHEPGDELHLYVRDHGNTISFYVVYRPASFSHTDIEEFVRAYKNILGEAVSAREERPGGMLTEADAAHPFEVTLR